MGADATLAQSATGVLGDKALAVFAFAAYHQLESGQAVKTVVRVDGQGHRADEEAVSELSTAGLVEASERDLAFTPAGTEMLAKVVSALKAACGA